MPSADLTTPDAVIRAFHDETNNRPERRLGPHQLDFKRQPEDNRPITFKEYAGVLTVDMPTPPLSWRTGPATRALTQRSDRHADLGTDQLARILAFSAGITRVIERPGMFIRYCRAASSAHSYPDIYVVCGDMDGIGAGVYYFHGLHLRLDRLRTGDFRGALAHMAADPAIARRPATIVITGVPWRAAWRSGERALRHVYWDTGGLLANMVAAANADGVDVHVALGFVDVEVTRLVGADGVNEFAVALASFGDEGTAAPGPPAIEALDLMAPPISTAEPLVLPLIVDAQHAGDLADADAVTAWRTRRDGRPAPAGPTAPPQGAKERSIEEVFLRRGSTRRMQHDALPRAALEWVMAAGTRPIPGDWNEPGRTLLQHVAIVHAIEGVPAGVHRSEADGLRLVREGALRDEATFVSLKQPQGGDGAYTTFHFADLDHVLSTLGPRGYRAAQLEGGYALERLHLAAFGFGTGATGLTFYDQEVSGLCGTTAAVMTQVAVGKPAYRAKAGRLGEDAVKITGRAFDLAGERFREVEAARQQRL